MRGVKTTGVWFVLAIVLGLGPCPTLFAQLMSCFGPDISPQVAKRITMHLQAVQPDLRECPSALDSSAEGTVLVFGRHPWRANFEFRSDDKAESIHLEKKELHKTTFYFAWGEARSGTQHAFVYGSQLASYALLEEFGFAFLHPLKPYHPQQLNFPAQLKKSESPHWPVRAMHLHTQHPLELTNLLNGWSLRDYKDRGAWMNLLPEWESYLEWCLANRQNHVAWYLLRAESWADFADSQERQQRLQKLVDLGHAYSLSIGVTAPLAFKQQHAWTMIRQEGDERAQIAQAIDWLAALNLDYIEIEMGTSEFTHPSDEAMLEWMNVATRYAADRYNMETWVKVHASSGQKAEKFQDPDTGEALNFNFLPYYADKRLAVMAHTVQIYGLDDPAPTYGNKNFSEIERYMSMEAGRRKVLYYPETAYWVSFDIDVPLFLPIYGERRLQDLRRLAELETKGKLGRGSQLGSSIQGQVTFSSGWEWSYWLNDVLSARAAWNPALHLNDEEALADALQVFTRIMGQHGSFLNQRLRKWVHSQNKLLIHGEVDGKSPDSIEMRSGMAYLAGVDAWDDIAWLLGEGVTQPRRKGLMDMRNPLKIAPRYDREIKPLLWAMRDQFSQLAALPSLPALLPKQEEYLNELRDSMTMTALRAKQISHLYESVDNEMDQPWAKDKARAEKLAAQKTLDEARIISERRSRSYRVEADRLISWQYGPTAYHYGYLWAAHSLFYWWRDEEKLTEKPLSPCYRNIVDPIDIANGEGPWDLTLPILGRLNVQELRDSLGRIPGLASQIDVCLRKPTAEPKPLRRP